MWPVTGPHVRDACCSRRLAWRVLKHTGEMGFVRGDASACVSHHPQRDVTTSVYGDDFTTCGSKLQLDWFKQQLEKKHELAEQCRLGPGAQDHKEGGEGSSIGSSVGPVVELGMKLTPATQRMLLRSST